mgnify:CR=1 FL=1
MPESDPITDDSDGLHRHTENIKDRFPEPLSLLLIEMAQRNREHWLESEDWRTRTIAAESIREYGLTENQRRFANQIAEQMGVPHDAYR